MVFHYSTNLGVEDFRDLASYIVVHKICVSVCSLTFNITCRLLEKAKCTANAENTIIPSNAPEIKNPSGGGYHISTWIIHALSNPTPFEKTVLKNKSSWYPQKSCRTSRYCNESQKASRVDVQGLDSLKKFSHPGNWGKGKKKRDTYTCINVHICMYVTCVYVCT